MTWAEFGRCLARDVVDALYPSLCPLCRAPAPADSPTGSCTAHAIDLERGLPGNRCARCAARIADALAPGEPCARCRIDPPAFARVLALGDYREDLALREWILRLKHGGRADLAHPLGGWLGEHLARRVGAPRARGALLVPVPLHPLRRFERGYDQADLLARAAALASGGVTLRILRRTRWTSPQGAIEAPSRSKNVHGAFAIAHGGLEFTGRAVWLVDDVLTSGATASACARVLREEGAPSVSVLCLARAGELRVDAGDRRVSS